MIKIDAIRHYLSNPKVILEGFLGKQNPFLVFASTPTSSLEMSILGALSTVEMYRPGQFGIDIYLPFSILPDIRAAIQTLGFAPAQNVTFQVFDPTGTERGPKRVPEVLVNMGRVYYSSSVSNVAHASWCSNVGPVYIDVETHDANSHKTWTKNPVMEPFELHFGVRGNAKGQDPFQECDGVVDDTKIHLTTFTQHAASQLLGRLRALEERTDYEMSPADGDNWDFRLTLDNDTYDIRKVYAPT